MFTPKDKRMPRDLPEINNAMQPDSGEPLGAGFADDFDSMGSDFDDMPPAPAAPEAGFVTSLRRSPRERRQFKMPQSDMPEDVQPSSPQAPPAAKPFFNPPPDTPTVSINSQPAAPADISSPQAQPAARPRFNPQPDAPAEPTAQPVPVGRKTMEIMDVEGGNSIFDQLKVKVTSLVTGRQPQSDEDFYTPPEGFVSNRIRYRVRNHRPLPIWVKSAALAVGILFVIYVIVKLIFFGSMVGQVNFVDSESHAPVRLTLDESAAMQAQLSEEITNDITLPTVTPRTDKDIQVILLAGVSNAIGSGDAGECDALLLVAIDHVHDKIKLVSIARELYAQIPDYRNNMIGEAFFYDSANGNRALDILRESVELNLCVKIDNIVSIDYDALQVIVNKLGGITMNITNEEAAYMSSHWKYGNFPRYTAGGLYTLSGTEMLNYLRMKYIGDCTDAQRVVRMRGVLENIYRSVGQTPAIDRTAAIYSVLPYVTTDMTSYQVYNIINRAGRLADYEFTGYSLPVNGSWGNDKVDINGEITEVVIANYTFNAEYLQKFIYDDDLTYTFGNSTNGVDIPYISEEAKAAAQAEENAQEQ